MNIIARIYQGQFRCLSSFLYAMICETRAAAAGMLCLDDDTGQFSVVRELDQMDGLCPTPPQSAQRGFSRWQDVIQSLIQPVAPKSSAEVQPATGRTRYLFRRPDGGSTERFVLLVHVWPPPTWPQQSSENYWIYLVETNTGLEAEPHFPEQ